MKQFALFLIFNLIIVFNVTAKSFYATQEVHIRAGAGKNYEILATLKKGEQIEVNEIIGAWGKVTYQNRESFINMNYLSEVPNPKFNGVRDFTLNHVWLSVLIALAVILFIVLFIAGIVLNIIKWVFNFLFSLVGLRRRSSGYGYNGSPSVGSSSNIPKYDKDADDKKYWDNYNNENDSKNAQQRAADLASGKSKLLEP